MDDIFRKMGQRAFGSKAPATGTKRATSPVVDVAAKKPAVAVSPNGLFQDPPTSSGSGNGSATAKEPRIPAIFMDAITDWETHAAKLSEKLTGGWEFIARQDGFKLQTRTLEDFRTAQRYCLTARLPIYTFSVGRGRCLKAVISGLPADTTADRLLDHLSGLRFEVTDAARLHTRRGPTRSWLVTFVADSCREDPESRRAAEIYKIHRIFWVTVRIAAYKRPAGPPQCHRCQGFGHGSSNCWRQLRCVRCGGDHQARACQLPSSEKGKCCNCNGRHNANYRGCSAYKAASARQAPAPPARPARPAPRLPAPAPAAAVDNTSDAEEDADQHPKKRRKRPPRNPANRRKKSEAAQPTAQTAEPAVEPRPTPRRKLDWPPPPVAAPPTAEEPEEAQPEEAQPADQTVEEFRADIKKEVAATAAQLTKVLEYLTNVCGTLSTLLQHL